MSLERRPWLDTVTDPAMLSDLLAAASDCMAQICADDPAECSCAGNRMTPIEFVEWLERERHIADRDGRSQFEPGHRPRTHRPAGLLLARAGWGLQ